MLNRIPRGNSYSALQNDYGYLLPKILVCSRPKTDVGHVVTGVVRSNLRSARTKTMEQSLKSARRAGSSRPLTTQSGRCVRLGTTSMITENHELFIDIRRMNLAKYATEISGKHLFEYLYYHDRDIQHVGW